MIDDTYDSLVSTVGDLARLDKSRDVGGQISDDGYQKSILAFTQMSMKTQALSKEADEKSMRS
jgi:hypothetical protein